MRSVYKMYKVTIVREGQSVTITAENRFGFISNLLIERDGEYFKGYSDFNSTKKRLKHIIFEYFQQLTREVRDYDNEWYKYHCFTKMVEEGFHPLTWEECSTKPLPQFKGSVIFKQY